MRALRRIAAGIAAAVLLLAILAWTCPADFAYRQLAAALEPLRLHDVSGTLWQGRAERAEFLGQPLGSLQWRVDAWPLLHATLAAHVDLDGPSMTASGNVERSRDAIAVAGASLHLPARVAAPAFAIPTLDLLGAIDIDVSRAVLRNLRLEAASGSATWREAAVAGAAQAALGDLRATFSADGAGGIAGQVRDLGGPLAADGTFTADLVRYHARVRLAPRGDNPQLSEALQYVGQPQADGSRDLEIEGRQLALPLQ